jgi:hypothetical protein
VKAGVIRKLAREHDLPALEAAAQSLLEGEGAPFEIGGDDDGERLTHVMLAQRIRKRVDAGEDLKAVFREVMGGVRTVMTDS